MKLNELRDTSYEIAKSKGWHDEDLKRSFADLMALVISELAEALEEHRAGRPAREIEYRKAGTSSVVWYRPGDDKPVVSHETTLRTALELLESGYKPEGVVIELADALIRIGDCAGEHELDLESVEGRATTVGELVQQNAGRTGTGRTDKRTTFGEWFCEISYGLCELGLGACDGGCGDDEPMDLTDPASREIWLISAASSIGELAHWLGITGEELERAIEIKHAYNRTRPRRHGGKLL